MKRLGSITVLISVILPLSLALWIGIANYESGHKESREKVAQLLRAGLLTLSTSIRAQFADWEVIFAKLPMGTQGFRREVDTNPLISHIFVLDEKGLVEFPKEDSELREEAEYAKQLSGFFGQGWTQPQGAEGSKVLNQGWDGYFWADGFRPFFYVKKDGQYLCVEPNQGAFYEKVLDSMQNPTIPQDNYKMHRVELRDQRGKLIKQWGRLRMDAPNQSELARVSISDQPLRGYTISWHMDDQTWQGQAATTGVFALLAQIVLLIVSIGLAFFGFYLMRRNFNEARNRISFVNQVSHELKTPLTNIRLYAEILQGELEDLGIEPNTTHKLSIITRESARLTRLIRNVLTFGKSQTPESLHPRMVSLNEVLSRSLETFSESYRERGLEIKSKLEATEILALDSDVIDQIAGNLLSNAEKYAREGKFIEIEAWQEGETLWFSVEDHGEGIAPEQVKRLFSPFTRFHTKTSDAEGGTGLGLYISKLLAERHGGGIMFENGKAGGALFKVFLKPLMQQQKNEQRNEL